MLNLCIPNNFLRFCEVLGYFLLGVEKKKISETSGKIVDRWGRGVILVIFLCTFPSVSTNDMNWLLILYLFLLLGFQSILEWKYLKNSK
ncbi:DUF4181 domain-containing protein [Peribacillus butanolivorans]|uniref:DUF4181 domain-containing protein n=1 Tax=Peribacillus butanolivorans TaxID=421767 RepID=UPI0037C530FD